MLTALGLLLALAIGVSLGFFGGGGSILAVPLLAYAFGLAPKTAIASSLLVVAAASAAGAVFQARAGRVHLRTGLLFGSAGMTGAYLGGRAAAWVDGGVLLLLFASIMALTGAAMWRGRSVPARPAAGYRPSRRGALRLLLQGLAVGSFTGLVGAGGGFLIVPALVLWAGLPLASATGTSLLIVVLQSLAGFAGYRAHVEIDAALVGAVAACATLGAVAGVRLARAVPAAPLRRAFAVFVLLMATGMLAREGSLVLETARAALPQTLPQLFFAALMLAVGALAGRAGREVERRGPTSFEQGEGI